MPISEKSFLERLTELIPGVKGYRDREGRRETDRRLREHLATRLEEARDALNSLRARVGDEEALGALDAVGRLDRALQKCAASLRYADQGYSGLFDQVRIGTRELDRLYAFDELLLDGVDALVERVHAAAAHGADAATLEEIVRSAERLARVIDRRPEVFETPIG